MNFSFNKNTYNSGPKLVIPKHISNRRIMSADAKTAGRKEPTSLTFAGLGKMGVDHNRSNIFEFSDSDIQNKSNLIGLILAGGLSTRMNKEHKFLKKINKKKP